MSNSAFSPSVLTVPSGTTGSGQGELNLITNPVAVTNTTGWVGAGRGTSGGPLSPTIETYFTVLNAFGSESSTSGAYGVISLPSGLQNKKLKVEFYFTSPAADTFKVSVYKGTTRVPLTTDVSGSTALPQSTTGKFVAYFDTDSSGTWTVSITRTAGTGATALQFTNVVVGPGIQPQGAVVGEWTRYTPSIVWPTTNQGTLDATGTQLQYRRVGSAIEIRGVVAMSAIGTSSSVLEFTLPSGLTPDQSVISASRNRRNDDVGSGSLYRATAVTTVLTFPRIDSAASSASGQSVFSFTTSAGGTPETYSSIVPANWTSSSDRLYMQVRIPIAEWAGSGTVQLAQNDVEFAFNSSATITSDSTTFGYGPQGVLLQAFAPSGIGAVTKRVQFQTPIQAGDQVVLEINDGNGWMPLVSRLNSFYADAAGTTYFGTKLTPVSGDTLKADILFFNKADSANTWSSISTWKWRVRKSSAGAAVGFGIVAPGVSSGLVSASGLPGNTTGNVVAAGYVGETISASVSSASSTGSTGVYFDAVNLPLTAGTWEITGYYRLIKNTAVFSFIKQELAFITATGNSVTGGVDNVNYQVMTDGALSVAFTTHSFNLPTVRVYCDGSNITVGGTTTSGTTLRLKALTHNYTSGQAQYTAAIKAVRIA